MSANTPRWHRCNRSFVKGFDVVGAEFAAIRDEVMSLLRETLISTGDLPSTGLATMEQVLDAVNRTTRLSVSRNWDSLTRLECACIRMLNGQDLLQGITAMEFPINVRVAHPKAPYGYLKGAFATDMLHSDVWAGEPEDIVNVLLYIVADEFSPYMDLWDFNQEDADYFCNFRGAYGQLPPHFERLAKIPLIPRPGLCLIFDGILPHQTVRQGSKARVSIDFRLRRADPYAAIDERWLQARGAFSRYWTLNPGSISTFKDKAAREFEMLTRRGNAGLTEARERAMLAQGMK